CCPGSVGEKQFLHGPGPAFRLQVKIWFQNRRMKWRNSKEKEVLSNRCLQEEGLQENYLSRSTLNLTSSCPSVWKVSQEQASPRWQEKSPEPAERLSNGHSAQPQRANSLQGTYVYPEQDTATKAVTSSVIKNDGVL
uniref:Homeobox domain-containing protein n=1 Tax=Crocodylus porosus TaxID=8502 RepID=A0A7M4EPF3_CROPO